MLSEEVEREMAKIPLSEDAIRETINNTLPNFANNATRNLQTSTINLQFLMPPNFGRNHVLQFVLKFLKP
jgi:hypothetical protein